MDETEIPLKKKMEVAHNAVARAIATCNLSKASTLSCIDCGKRALDWDHAFGYEPVNWLNVQPVCRSCHKKRGFKRGEQAPNQGAECPHGIRGKSYCLECQRQCQRYYRARRREHYREQDRRRYLRRKASRISKPAI